MVTQEIQKGKSIKQKQSRRRRQRAVDSEALEYPDGAEGQVGEIGEGKAVEDEEISIVEPSSKIQPSRQIQGKNILYISLIKH